ncbi:MAG: GntR family transcriptional regulator, partial [Streptomyces sp.]
MTSSPSRPVVHSLREQIRERIVDGIVSGRWQP